MNNLSEDDKKFITGTLAMLVENFVQREQTKMLEHIAREEIRKQLERFIFVVAIPKSETGN